MKRAGTRQLSDSHRVPVFSLVQRLACYTKEPLIKSDAHILLAYFPSDCTTSPWRALARLRRICTIWRKICRAICTHRFNQRFPNTNLWSDYRKKCWPKISIKRRHRAPNNFHNFLIDFPLIGCYNINIKKRQNPRHLRKFYIYGDTYYAWKKH